MSIHVSYEQREMPYHEVVARLVQKYYEDNGSIIDIGCGLGYTLANINKKMVNANLTAVDIDSNCLDATGKRVKLREKLQINSINDLKKINKQYNTVILSHVLEHTIDPINTIKVLLEITQPGGVLILAVPNPVRPGVFISSLRKRHYVNHGHIFSWDRSHWMNFLERILGLNVVCYASDYIELPFLKRWKIFNTLGVKLVCYFPWLSFSNIAVIRKTEQLE